MDIYTYPNSYALVTGYLHPTVKEHIVSQMASVWNSLIRLPEVEWTITWSICFSLGDLQDFRDMLLIPLFKNSHSYHNEHITVLFLPESPSNFYSECSTTEVIFSGHQVQENALNKTLISVFHRLHKSTVVRCFGRFYSSSAAPFIYSRSFQQLE